MRIARPHLCVAGVLVVFTGLISVPHMAAAREKTSLAETPRDAVPMQSFLGSYLAGRVARGLNDTDLAVHFYRKALKRSPRHPRIIERSFLMEATEGNWAAATKVARRLVKQQPKHRLARFLLGISAFKRGKYKQADKHLKMAAVGPIGELTSALTRAWVAVAMKKKRLAFRRLDEPKKADWSRFYLRYHRALIADVLGDRKAARQNYRRIFAEDSRTPRTAAAYIRHALRSGNYRLAGQIARTHIKQSSSGGHETIRFLYDKITAGKPAELVVTSPRDGIAEVFCGLGEALTSEGGLNLGTVYLQMALSLKQDFPFAQASLANVYETTKRYGRAISVYNKVRPNTALQPSIEIRKAVNLDSMDRVDEAKAVLDKLAEARPDDIRPLEAIGNILRSRKRYREAITYYTRLLKLLPKEEKKQHWTYWYARGTSYERIKDWPNAEKDLLKAMELDPNQALILNYLGYSWVDQKIHLTRGLKLIEKAVSLKPDDGYIVDSLGWAHYRLGDFDKAVKHLERAVELRPEDPILNDHLGDALWRVGRKREARYQWEQALTLKPEKKNATEIRQKLLVGLPDLPGVKAVDGNKNKPKKNKGLGKRAEIKGNAAPAAPVR